MKLEFPFFCPRCGRVIEKISISNSLVEIFCENCEKISIKKQEFIERLEHAIPLLKEEHEKEILRIQNLIETLQNEY
ncbi:MAG: hypothetical protein E7035_01515 [Verrucomicrobiaceae bacterium]|nr:hypothetical protein [Verrucomicrobiaceae bacterium]